MQLAETCFKVENRLQRSSVLFLRSCDNTSIELHVSCALDSSAEIKRYRNCKAIVQVAI